MAIFFGEERISSFRAAGRIYLERINYREDSDFVFPRAQETLRKLLTDLRSVKRADLVFKLATFLVVTAKANPLYFLLEPPVMPREANALLKKYLAPEMLETADKIVSPIDKVTFVHRSELPKLCCFGFLIFELFGPELAKEISDNTSFESCEVRVKELNRFITRMMSEKLSEEGYSEHTHRSLREAVNALEHVGGAELDFAAVSDEMALDAWTHYSLGGTEAKSKSTRFITWLTLLSELSRSVELTASVSSLDNMSAIHDEKITYKLDADASTSLNAESDDGRLEFALSDPMIIAILGKDASEQIKNSLIEFKSLRQLYLSRLRALTFRSGENSLIQAKRNKKNNIVDALSANLRAMSFVEFVSTYRASREVLCEFVKVQIYLHWSSEQRSEAMQLIVKFGFLSAEEIEIILADLSFLKDKTAVPSAVVSIVDEGKISWKNLKRRSVFKAENEQAAINNMEDAIDLVSDLLLKMEKDILKLEKIAVNYSRYEQFEAEVSHYQKRLLKIHQLKAE